MDKPTGSANPLEAFQLEAQVFAPARRGAAAVAVAPLPAPSRGPATVHDLPAAAEARVIKEVGKQLSKESAETRRRLIELKQALEAAIAKQAADLERLNWTLRIAIYILLAIGLSQIGLIVWTKR